MHGNPNLKRAGTFGLSMVAYWLMKSEPHVYPYEQLVKDGSTHWDGVRNYQARNLMRDEMKMGDLVLFYHSNFKPPHVVGISRVCREGYPDFTAQDPNSKYFDVKATPDNPRWMMVDIEPVIELPQIIPLEDIKLVINLFYSVGLKYNLGSDNIKSIYKDLTCTKCDLC